MDLTWTIPRTKEDPLTINLDPSSRVFIIGANGAGKSALMQHAVRELGSEKVRRISAHRQTWMESGTIDMTAQTRRQFRQNLNGEERNDRYRYSEWAPLERISSVLFDLTAKENDLARRITNAVYDDDQDEVNKIRKGERRVFDRINELFALAGFKVTIENSEGEELLARHSQGNLPYDIAQMSDGERNAAIIAANVLTVEEGTILLIDEPERHLHRSIIEPFLSALFSQRPDCPFVISTHEVNLVLGNPDSQVLILRSCQWDEQVGRPASWDIKLLDTGDALPQDLKEAILGSNRRILFTEGAEHSLDFPMYNALFPGVSIRPMRNSDGVIKAVRGLREAQGLHDVEAIGLIDRDDRTDDQVADLQAEGIYALRTNSVESLYYCQHSMIAVAEWQSLSLDYDAGQKVEEAKHKALGILKAGDVAKRMSARHCERVVGTQLRSLGPSWKQILEGEANPIDFDASSIYCDELKRFQLLLDANHLDDLIRRYPLRETNAFKAIADALQIPKANYEKTVVSRVRADHALASKLRELIQPLSDVLQQEDA